MLDWLVDLSPVGIVGLAMLVLGLGLGFKLFGFPGLLIGGGISLVLGIWVENTTNPSVTRLRNIVQWSLIAAVFALMLYQWLARH